MGVTAALPACPGRTKRHVGANLPVPTNGNQQALERFQQSKAQFERDAHGLGQPAATGDAGTAAAPGTAARTASEFEAIAHDYPDDPIAPHALLYAGMSALRAGQPERAATSLERLVDSPDADPLVVKRGQLFYGIALGYLGKPKKALIQLAAGRDALDTDDADERAAYDAALAEASAQTGRLADAVVAYDAWYPDGRAAEKVYVLARLRELVAEVPEADLAGAYNRLASKKGPGAALLATRLADQADARGDHDRASDLRDETESARRALGLITTGGAGEGGDPARVGGVLSLSGKRNRLGDFSMRGLALAAGIYNQAGAQVATQLGFPRPFQLAVRDDASEATGAAGAVDALAAQNVIAIVGPDDGRAVEHAAREANLRGVPLISLHPASELLQGVDSPFVFHVVHSAAQRARILARHAVAAGVHDFAILAPDNGYGRAVGDAFRAEVERRGGQVVVAVRYPPGEKSFQGYIKKLHRPWQAVFVPDRASTLELVAPSLAVANLYAAPLGAKVKHGRAIWLLSTAELVDPGFLPAAGRYTRGALLAPGFYADRTDERIAEFVARYQQSFGRAPTALDAYAFDAAWAVRAAVAAGAQSRRAVADWLAGGTLVGLTGTIQFDSTHRRADDGILYTVEETHPDQYELRAHR